MYRVLIADDEGIVRESLDFIIKKDFKEQCETLFAKSGRQAIELAEEYHPEIAFLDIQMPGINGLSALREIKKQNPKIKTVILTAYDNFDYAKEAIGLGAADYVMKPIDRKKINENLQRFIHELDEEKRKRNDELKVRERMEAVEPIIENGFVLSLITRNEYAYSGIQYRNLLGIEEEHGFIVVLEWDDEFRQKRPENPVGASVRGSRFAATMGEKIRAFLKAYLSTEMGNKIFCAVPARDTEERYSIRLRNIGKVRSLVTSLEEMTGIEFHAGIGSVQLWKDMFESYIDAINALHYGVCSVTHIDDLIVQDKESRQNSGRRKNVLDALRSAREQRVRTEAERYGEWLLNSRRDSDEDIRIELLELLMEGRKLITEQGKTIKNKYEYELIKEDNPADILNIFADGMVRLCREIVLEYKTTDTMVSRAQEYIRQNFQSDISLECVAEEVNISPYYFSKLFKQEAGIGFNDYVTGLRIERAEELLNRQELSMKEVCAKSGYANPNYFSRVFKRWTGMTPTEYRERCDGRKL